MQSLHPDSLADGDQVLFFYSVLKAIGCWYSS